MGLTTMKLDLVNMNVLIILPGLAYGASIPAKTVSEIKKTTIDDTELLRVQTWAVETIGPKTRVELDETDNGCVWIGAADGQAFPCPTGYQAVGVCGVGAYADCNGYFFELQCCNMNLPAADSSFYYESSIDNLYSYPGIVLSGCGSGSNPTGCRLGGVPYYGTTQVADFSSIGWYFYKYTGGGVSGASGQRISCLDVNGDFGGDYHDYTGAGIRQMVSMCVSGSTPACDKYGTSYTFIQCGLYTYCDPNCEYD